MRQIDHIRARRRAAGNFANLLSFNHDHNIPAQRIPAPVKQTPTPQRHNFISRRTLPKEISTKQKEENRGNGTSNLSDQVSLRTEN